MGSLLAGTRSRLAVAGGRSRNGLLLGVPQDGLLKDVRVDDGGREARVVGGDHEGVVSQILGVVRVESQKVEGMPLVDSGIETGAREGRHRHQGRQMLLLPMLDEIVPG
jgi:hypothetical protein